MASSSKSSPEEITLNQTGQCLCGNVQFKISGKVLFNQLCHCRACGRARGMTPVHLIGVLNLEVLKGKDVLKTKQGMGSMEHTFCADCSSGIYQRPKNAKFYATFPTSFQMETPAKEGVPSSLLPSDLQPTMHTNYENRLTNYYDSLPKYKGFPGEGTRMTDEGEIIVVDENNDT